VLPSRFLQTCAALAASSSEKINVPLVALRRFTIESRYSDKKLDDAMHLDRNDWIWDLARLPLIESICVPRISNHFSTTSRPQTSNLKALTLTSMTMFPEKLRKILTMCPVLEDLRAMWSSDENSLFKNEYM
jgi:vacuolar-type H+-ATPase subunit B/Vma2